MGDEIIVENRYRIPRDRLYTKTDEWVKIENGVGVVGITDYAQQKLRDIVGVELPEVGAKTSRGEPVATLESVKTVAEVYSPLTGEIIEVNEELYDQPELINQDPYGKGWIYKVKPEKLEEEEKELLTPEAYAEKIRKQEE